VQNAVDSDVISPHRINDDVRRAGYDQLPGSRDASGTAAVGVICEARDGCCDFVGKSVGRSWVALSDILELLFEIALRGAQPDDPHRPRLSPAFFISLPRRARHFRTTSS